MDSETGVQPKAPPVLRVAIVGLGRWGPNLLRCLQDDSRCRVLYAVDCAASRLDLVRRTYPAVRACQSLDDVLRDPNVDAVFVSTPASTHFAVCRRVLGAGKHCFVEKPLANSLNQAYRLSAEASARQLTLGVGHVFLYNASINRVKAYLDHGALGTVHYLSMIRTNLGPPTIDVDVAWDLTTHDVSIANYWLNGPPAWVTATAGAWMFPPQIDSVFVTLKYPGGEIAHLVASWLSPRKVRHITIVGSNLMATVDDTNIAEPLRIYHKAENTHAGFGLVDSHEGFWSSIRDGDVHIPGLDATEPLREECRDFVEAVLSKRAPVSSGQVALPVVATIEAIHRALVEERTVPVVL